MNPEIILALQDCPKSMAIATVLSTFLGCQSRFISHSEIRQGLYAPQQSLAVLAQNEVDTLVQLRRTDFPGPVIILSSEPLDSLRDQHPILHQGSDASRVWEINIPLSKLLDTVKEIYPLGDNFLEEVQENLPNI